MEKTGSKGQTSTVFAIFPIRLGYVRVSYHYRVGNGSEDPSAPSGGAPSATRHPRCQESGINRVEEVYPGQQFILAAVRAQQLFLPIPEARTPCATATGLRNVAVSLVVCLKMHDPPDFELVQLAPDPGVLANLKFQQGVVEKDIS